MMLRQDLYVVKHTHATTMQMQHWGVGCQEENVHCFWLRASTSRSQSEYAA